MCVLTYLPQSGGEVVITHNRDEHFSRPIATPPTAHVLGGQTVLYPTDPQGGGTWFAIHPDWICCLLNGGFERHERRLPYRASRGTVIPAFLEQPAVNDFLDHFQAEGIEPFTLVLFDLRGPRIHEIVWDGAQWHSAQPDPARRQIWSSATLYDASVKGRRGELLDQWLREGGIDADRALDLHRRHVPDRPGDGFWVDLPNGVRTVALTQVYGRHGAMRMRYVPA